MKTDFDLYSGKALNDLSWEMDTARPTGLHPPVHARLSLADVDETKEKKHYKEPEDNGRGVDYK